MLLRRLQIENFRAIRSIDLELDETIALIGENGSGKTSVFDALDACLGVRQRGPALRFERHHFRPLPEAEGEEAIDEIRVRLRFAEREAGEWPESQRSHLAPAVVEGPEGKLCILWEVTARWDNAAAEARTSWRFLGHDGRLLNHPHDEGLIVELRRLNPFLLFGHNGQWHDGEHDLEIASAERLLAVGGDDLEQTTREIFGKLSEGWESLSAQEMRQARATARRIWKRLTHWRGGSAGANRKSSAYRLPSGGAQSLGPLLVFGSLLQARGARPLEPDVEPIIGGDHIGALLHPATLGSVWHVLESLPAQKIVSTYSGELVSAMPLAVLRRMVRRRKQTDVHRFHPDQLQPDELRRLGYHIRARRGGALFDRCWLLVEGETEFWLLPEMARFSGYRFDAEGVSVVEFAQCGLDPIVKLARHLGISWHLLADGDEAGNNYVNAATALLDGAPFEKHITQLPEGDIEQYLWGAGYSEVYIQAIRAKRGHRRRDRRSAIQRAVNTHSKPFLALSVLDACAKPDSPGVPPLLKQVIDKAVLLARSN